MSSDYQEKYIVSIKCHITKRPRLITRGVVMWQVRRLAEEKPHFVGSTELLAFERALNCAGKARFHIDDSYPFWSHGNTSGLREHSLILLDPTAARFRPQVPFGHRDILGSVCWTHC